MNLKSKRQFNFSPDDKSKKNYSFHQQTNNIFQIPIENINDHNKIKKIQSINKEVLPIDLKKSKVKNYHFSQVKSPVPPIEPKSIEKKEDPIPNYNNISTEIENKIPKQKKIKKRNYSFDSNNLHNDFKKTLIIDLGEMENENNPSVLKNKKPVNLNVSGTLNKSNARPPLPPKIVQSNALNDSIKESSNDANKNLIDNNIDVITSKPLYKPNILTKDQSNNLYDNCYNEMKGKLVKSLQKEKAYQGAYIEGILKQEKLKQQYFESVIDKSILEQEKNRRISEEKIMKIKQIKNFNHQKTLLDQLNQNKVRQNFEKELKFKETTENSISNIKEREKISCEIREKEGLIKKYYKEFLDAQIAFKNNMKPANDLKKN